MTHASPSRLSGLIAAIAGLIALLATTGPLHAQTSQDVELEAAFQAAWGSLIAGPGTIKLLDQGTLNLGAEHGFVPPAQAIRLMHAMGNNTGNNMLGLIIPRGGDTRWFITVEFDQIGFAAPEMLARLNEKDIYDHLRHAATRGNEGRLELEAGKLDVGGFIEPPRYDRANNRMYLATRVVQAGPSDDRENSANLDAYVFGREGVLTFTLATGESDYKNLRRHMDQAYLGTTFLPGKRSADAVPGQDRVVEYPLEMIFGGQTAAEIKDKKAKVASLAAARERRRAAQAAAAQAESDSWTFWLIAGLGVLVAVGGGAIVYHLAGSADEGGSARVRAPSRGTFAIDQAMINRAVRKSQTA